jgi:hypothetical protein
MLVISAYTTGHVFALYYSKIFYSLRLLTIYHQVTLKNIWKMYFGAKLRSTYVCGLSLYPFGVSEDRVVKW